MSSCLSSAKSITWPAASRLPRKPPPISNGKTNLKAVQGLAEIIVAKHRHGPIGTVKLAFSAPLTRFSNLTDKHEAQS